MAETRNPTGDAPVTIYSLVNNHHRPMGSNETERRLQPESLYSQVKKKKGILYIQKLLLVSTQVKPLGPIYSWVQKYLDFFFF